MTNEAGEKVWSAEHKPFGKATVNTDVDGDGEHVELNARFPGQQYDKETGLHYNYYRYYNPSTGRYMTSDPIGLRGGLNTYGYVGGNPVNYTDPRGLYPSMITDGVYKQGKPIAEAAKKTACTIADAAEAALPLAITGLILASPNPIKVVDAIDIAISVTGALNGDIQVPTTKDASKEHNKAKQEQISEFRKISKRRIPTPRLPR